MGRFAYGKRSKAKLDTVHPDLRRVMERAILRTPYDITIVHGWRGEEAQNALYETGASTKRWPDSKHNATLPNGMPMSEAVDFAPWIDGSIPWKDIGIFCVVAGVILASASEIGVKMRWGGDWDGDGSTLDHQLRDYGHMEIVL